MNGKVYVNDKIFLISGYVSVNKYSIVCNKIVYYGIYKLRDKKRNRGYCKL